MTLDKYPSADVTITDWTTAPIWSKVNNLSDASFASITNPTFSSTMIMELEDMTEPTPYDDFFVHVRARLVSGSFDPTNLNVTVEDTVNFQRITFQTFGGSLSGSFTEIVFSSIFTNPLDVFENWNDLNIEVTVNGGPYTAVLEISSVEFVVPGTVPAPVRGSVDTFMFEREVDARLLR